MANFALLTGKTLVVGEDHPQIEPDTETLVFDIVDFKLRSDLLNSRRANSYWGSWYRHSCKLHNLINRNCYLILDDNFSICTELHYEAGITCYQAAGSRRERTFHPTASCGPHHNPLDFPQLVEALVEDLYSGRLLEKFKAAEAFFEAKASYHQR